MQNGRFLSAETDATAWQAVLGGFPGTGRSELYYTASYARLYETQSVTPRSFCFTRGKDVFFLPFMRIGIPGAEGAFCAESPYGYPGLLSTSASSDFLKEAWSSFKDNCLAEHVVSLLLRFDPFAPDDQFAYAAPLCKPVLVRNTVVLNIARSYETIHAEYESGTRNKVKKAVQNGVTVTRDDSGAALRRFCDAYGLSMEQKHASEFYRFGPAYFERVARLLKEQFSLYSAAAPDGGYLGGALVLYDENNVYYHLSAVNEAGRRTAAAGLLRDHVVREWAGKRTRMNFGGGLSADPDDSLFRFKKGFSRESLPFHVAFAVLDTEGYRTHTEAWDRRHANAPGSRFHRFLD